LSARVSRWVAVIVGLGALTACGDGEPNSRTDVSEDDIAVNIAGVNVEAMPDRYPNVAWRCAGRNGLYTTTDRLLYIVVMDPNCGAENRATEVIGPDDAVTTTSEVEE
jgi:hypothetical protein